MVLKLPQDHEDSEYVLSFEIGQHESGFYSERTDRIRDRQNHRQTESCQHPVPYYNIDIFNLLQGIG